MLVYLLLDADSFSFTATDSTQVLQNFPNSDDANELNDIIIKTVDKNSFVILNMYLFCNY